MKLLVFLGAGVSMDSGLPNARELTDKLFRRRPGEDAAAPRIRRLLRLLRKHDTNDIRRVGIWEGRDGRLQSSGAIYRGARSTYEDLFFLCQEINAWCVGLSDHSLTTPFLEMIERNAGDLLTGRSSRARLLDLSRICSRSCDFIEGVATRTLRQPYGGGLDLLLELASANDIDQLNIVTLNHDTLVEQLFGANGVQYVDGFGASDGDRRWPNDQVYGEAGVKVRLFKLHGSVDWFRFVHEGGFQTASVRGFDPKQARDGAGEPLAPVSWTPSFLSGINKATAYNGGIYADMHFRFQGLLRQADRIVMSGYGWGDSAINSQISTWLDRSAKRRLILLHRYPSQLVEHSFVMAGGFNGWVRLGRLAVVERWLSEVALPDIRALLD